MLIDRLHLGTLDRSIAAREALPLYRGRLAGALPSSFGARSFEPVATDDYSDVPSTRHALEPHIVQPSIAVALSQCLMSAVLASLLKMIPRAAASPELRRCTPSSVSVCGRHAWQRFDDKGDMATERQRAVMHEHIDHRKRHDGRRRCCHRPLEHRPTKEAWDRCVMHREF